MPKLADPGARLAEALHSESVSTASARPGVVRVNNLAMLEALYDVIASGTELSMIAFGSFFIHLRWNYGAIGNEMVDCPSPRRSSVQLSQRVFSILATIQLFHILRANHLHPSIECDCFSRAVRLAQKLSVVL